MAHGVLACCWHGPQIWQTLDGTRAVVKEMRAIKMEKYPLQNFAGYDYSDIMQLLQGRWRS